MSYYVISLKHTNNKDKYITLWRPDNKGYCWPAQWAGVYTEYIRGYHHSDENKAIPKRCD